MSVSTHRGVILDLSSFGSTDLSLGSLMSALEHWQVFETTSRVERKARLLDATVAVASKVVLDADAIAEAPNLRLICVAATGVNNVDLAAAKERGIVVSNVRDYAAASVSQHVMMLVLALGRSLISFREDVRANLWQKSDRFCLLNHPIQELTGLTLGIVGYGNLGRAVGDLAAAFGMTVKVANRVGAPPTPGRLPLAELLPLVDVLSLHCPLAPATEKLINAETLSRMKRSALLINTARGGLIDEPALVEALRKGVIGGAGVDVLSSEPPRTGNPLLVGDIPNLIITPHIAWAGRQARQKLIDELALNIHSFVDGTPRNVV